MNIHQSLIYESEVKRAGVRALSPSSRTPAVEIPCCYVFRPHMLSFEPIKNPQLIPEEPELLLANIMPSLQSKSFLGTDYSILDEEDTNKAAVSKAGTLPPIGNP